jgi:hypothetical protein
MPCHRLHQRWHPRHTHPFCCSREGWLLGGSTQSASEVVPATRSSVCRCTCMTG